ncbi:unnamed protein product [Rotaria sp. Silwood2]|nr:unnamed protein product [Rotaria sp. Silwood2]CAF4463719.1 unnamed protein product [Rotaria sp. Silwood2]
MNTEEQQSKNTFKKTVIPLYNNGNDWKQQEQYDDSSLSASTTTKDLNLESTRLIWYDSNIDTTNDTKKTMKEFYEINNFVVFHSDLESCINYIESIKNEKILLVTSGRDASFILIRIHQLKQIDSIFIFCFKPDKYQYLLGMYTKIIGIYTKRQELINSIKENLILIEKYFETFNLFNQHKEKSTRDLTKESAEFLWFQMFKDVILRLPKNNHAKKQMIEYCKNYYYGNEKELKYIREFEQDYQSHMAIKWYTKQTFLYKIVNKALRTEDIELLRIFRFFIADLSYNLANEYEKLKKQDEQFLIVYRGFKMDEKELENFKKNQGCLISTNGFLSTSRSKNVAIKFAKKLPIHFNIIPVLYEIECNVKELNSIIFADITQLSVFANESEVLFDLGSTFEIMSVKEDFHLNLWIIKLRATDNGIKIAKEYIELNRKEEEETSIELMFGKLLADMGQYDQALKYFQNLLLDSYTNKNDIPNINNLIGTIFYDKENFEHALQYYDLAYNLMINDKPARIKDSVKPLTNIALLFHRKGHYNLAYELYRNSLNIYNDYYGTGHIKSTRVLMNIGNIFTETKKYAHALGYYKQVLKIQQECLPSYHIDTAMTLNNIAVVYHKLNDIDHALEYYQQSLNMKEKVLPSDHKDVQMTRNSIAKINKKKSHLQFTSTAQSAQKQLHIQHKLQSTPMISVINSDKSLDPDNLIGGPQLHLPVIREQSNPLFNPQLHYPCVTISSIPGRNNITHPLDYEMEENSMIDEDTPELHYTISLKPQY